MTLPFAGAFRFAPVALEGGIGLDEQTACLTPRVTDRRPFNAIRASPVEQMWDLIDCDLAQPFQRVCEVTSDRGRQDFDGFAVAAAAPHGRPRRPVLAEDLP
jgi:hypothetical protein